MRITTAGATRPATQPGHAAMEFATTGTAGTTATIHCAGTIGGDTDPLLTTGSKNSL